MPTTSPVAALHVSLKKSRHLDRFQFVGDIAATDGLDSQDHP